MQFLSMKDRTQDVRVAIQLDFLDRPKMGDSPKLGDLAQSQEVGGGQTGEGERGVGHQTLGGLKNPIELPPRSPCTLYREY